MSRYGFRKYCKDCEKTLATGDTINFLKDFFTGSNCLGCGSSNLTTEFGSWVRKKKFNLIDISTWFSSYIWKNKGQK